MNTQKTALRQIEHLLQSGQLDQALAVALGALKENPTHSTITAIVGIIYYQARDFKTAATYFSNALKLGDLPDIHLVNAALAFQAVKRFRRAEKLLNSVLSRHPDHPSALVNLMTVYERQSRFEDAHRLARKILKRYPDSQPIGLQVIYFLCRQENFSVAIRHLLKLSRIEESVPVLSQLTLCYEQTGKLSRAKSVLRRCLPIHPLPALVHNNLGLLDHKTGHYQRAKRHFMSGIAVAPEMAMLHNNLGMVYQSLGQNEAAKTAYLQAIELDPALDKAFDNLGMLHYKAGDFDSAVNYYKKALLIQPTDGRKIRLKTLLPVVYTSTAEMNRYRARISQFLARGKTKKWQLDPILTQLAHTQFMLSYQGYDDAGILTDYYELLRPYLPENCVSLTPKDPKGNKKRNKIKIGFISRYFCAHSVMLFYASFILRLPKSKFEITLFPIGSKSDDITRKLKAKADKWVPVVEELHQARQQILSRDLDILVYIDLGMEPFTYYLSFTKLARHTIVFAGHPVTSGVKTVDYYLSSRLFEPVGAANYYAEKLMLVDGLLVDYPKPKRPKPVDLKALIGADAQSNTYVCPMVLFKYHPDFDMAIKGILAGDPNGVFVGFNSHPGAMPTLMRRLTRQLGKRLMRRVKFLPFSGKDQFLGILARADVVLETFPFGGGNTGLMALGAGTPVVTFPGEFLRNRWTQGYYQRMGIPELTAKSVDHYVEIALKLGKDKVFQAEMRRKIAENRSILYQNPEGVDQAISLFEKLVM